MPSTYSSSLKIQLIGIGEETNAWGSITNTNFQYALEQAIVGYTTALFPSDADYDWGALYVNSNSSQEQRNLVVEVLGSLSATRNFVVPTLEKEYVIFNSTVGGQSIVVKTSAGTGITVPNGAKAHLYVDGTNVTAMFNYMPTMTVGTLALTSALPVTSGGTGATSLSSITVGAATNVAGGAANRIPYNTGAGTTAFIAAPVSASTYLQWDGSAFTWTAVSSGVSTFSGGTTGLTPATATTGAITLAGTLAVANGGTGVTSSTGTGSVVLSNSPTLVTPTLGVATATSVNKLAITAPATSATLAIADGQTLTVSKSMTLTKTGSSSTTYTFPGSTCTIPGSSISNNWIAGANDFSYAISTQGLWLGFTGLSNLVLRSGNSTGIDNLLPTAISAEFNVTVGGGFVTSITNGSYNTSVGASSAIALTTGDRNAIFGYYNLRLLTSGSDNIAVGSNNLESLVSGSSNIGIGRYVYETLASTSADNIGIGSSAGYGLASGSQNIFIGKSASNSINSGNNNIAIGFESFYASGSYSNVSNQVSIGTQTMYQLGGVPSGPNVAIGYQTAYTLTTGGGNVVIGDSAGYSIYAGSNNVFIGKSAGNTSSTGSSNSMCLGNGAELSTVGANNQITLGNSSISSLRCQVTTITALSDARDKTNIVDIPAGLDFVNLLRPVSFDWNMRDGGKVGIPEFGFIAQQLQQAQQQSGVTVPNLVLADNPDRLEASPGSLIPVMVKAIQELSEQVESLKRELAALRG